MVFDWNDDKAAKNLKDHGVSFKTAQTVFDDPLAVDATDDRDYDEERFIVIGLAKNLTLLFVVYTERGDRIRIISARKATPNEQKYYSEQARG